MYTHLLCVRAPSTRDDRYGRRQNNGRQIVPGTTPPAGAPPDVAGREDPLPRPPRPSAYTWATNRARTSYNNNNNIIAATTGFFFLYFSPTLRTIIFLLYFTERALSPFPSSGGKCRGRPNTVPGITTRPAPTQINNIVLNQHKCRVLRAHTSMTVSCVCMRFFQTFTVTLSVCD